MANYIRDIPFVQMRPNSAECGAACLRMVYLYYGIDIPITEIWERIKWRDPITHRENCQTYKMPLHAQSIGLFSVAVSCDSPLTLLDICRQNDIIPIALYRPSDETQFAHFSVVVGENYRGVLINDPDCVPEKGNRLPVKTHEFVQRMRPLGISEMVTPNTFVLVANTEIPTVSCLGIGSTTGKSVLLQLPECLIAKSIRILSPEYDEWFSSLIRT